MVTLEKSIAMTTDARRGQPDKGGHPYIFHPLRLMLQMSTMEGRIVAVLHDVVEDNPDYSLRPPERWDTAIR
jgi:(p)ppGpp synthase/HD superfamily hydrolase